MIFKWRKLSTANLRLGKNAWPSWSPRTKDYLLRIKTLFKEKDEMALAVGAVFADLTAERNTALLATVQLRKEIFS